MAVPKKFLDEICLLLETYKGRDKILRTLCYVTKLIGGLSKDPNTSTKFLKFSSIMSQTRATLRLLDDLPMLKFNLEYGLGRDEPDKYMSCLGVVTNVVDQFYYPVEKVSWFAENNLISGVSGSKWDTLSSIFWVCTIYLTLIKSLGYIIVLQKYKACLQQNNGCPIETLRGVQENAMPPEFFKNLHRVQKNEMMNALRLSIDFIHAVNTLPPGFLWSSKLKTWHVGFIGTVSSILGIYQIFYRRGL